MNKIIELTKVLIKTGGRKDTTNPAVISRHSMMNIITCVFAVPLIYVLYLAGYSLTALIEEISGTGVIIETALVVVSLAIIGLGTVNVMNYFYMSSDLETFLILPYKPVEIVMAKFICVLLPSYYFSILGAAPLLTGIGVAAHAGVEYWIYVVLSVIFLPFLPMVYSGLIGIVFMRIFKRARNRSMWAAVAAFLPLIGTFAYSAVRQLLDQSSSTDIANLVGKSSGTIYAISDAIPSARILQWGLVEGGILPAISILLLSGVTLLLFLFAAKQWYLDSALDMKNGTFTNKVIQGEALNKYTKGHSAKWAYTRKELKLFIRTPAYLVRGFCLPALTPLMCIGMTFFLLPKAQSQGAFSSYIGFMETQGLITMQFLLMFILSFLVGMLNSVSATAISREGDQLYLMRQWPMEYKMQLKAKRNAGLIISFITTMTYVILVGIAGIAYGILSIQCVIGFLVTGMLMLWIINNMQLFLDLRNPLLSWTNETLVMTQPSKLLPSWITSTVIIIAMVVLNIVMDEYLKLPELIHLIVIWAILLVVAWALDKLVMKYGEKRLSVM